MFQFLQNCLRSLKCLKQEFKQVTMTATRRQRGLRNDFTLESRDTLKSFTKLNMEYSTTLKIFITNCVYLATFLYTAVQLTRKTSAK